MEKQSTKQIIITEALKLFSQKGYSGASIRDIAKSVGIKESSIYKHYKSKQDIFNSIIKYMQSKYLKAVSGIGIEGTDAKKAYSDYIDVTDDKLIEIALGLFMFMLHDEENKMYRHMLTIEQYSSKEVGDLYLKNYLKDTIDFQSNVFDSLIKLGKMRNHPPKLLAMQFFSPILMLIMQCDLEPECEHHAIEILKEHIILFNKNYIL